MRFFLRKLTSAFLLGLLLAPSANAVSTVSLPFSEPDFEWLATGGVATPYHVWTAGDYWRQTFTGTGLASATDLSLDLTINDAASENLNFDAFVNGANVGSFTLLANMTGLHQFLLPSFGPIAGDPYSIELRATSTVSGGNGSFSLDLTDGVSFATLSGTAIPEPSTVVLVGLGLIGLGYAGRRKLVG